MSVAAMHPETLGIIGDPVAHSLSPAMHTAALRALGFAETYGRWHTPAALLPERITQLRQPGMRGANVTLPHKVAVAALLDHLDATAATLGAVNTVVRRSDGTLHGYNTDAPAVVDSLRALQWNAGGAIVLGAGGAARAALYALRQLGARTITVVNRTPARAAALLQPGEQALAPDDAALPARMAAATLVINATTLGWQPADPAPLAVELLHPQLLVYDMVYRATALLRAAEAAGAATCDGLDMLVRQAGRALTLWLELPAPLKIMRAAAEAALEAAH